MDPSLRHDVLTGRDVLVAPSRADRPRSDERRGHLPQGPDPCPFCPGREDRTPPETGRLPAGEWQARAFPNLHPLVGQGAAAGRHEVIVLARAHDTHLGRLDPAEAHPFLALARDRIAALQPHGWPLLFVNHGRAAGATLPHPHAQLVASPAVPPLLVTERSACTGGTCAVCDDLVDAVAGPGVVLADDRVVAWCPEAGSHPYEIRVAPREHTSTWDPVTEGLADVLPRLVDALDRLLARRAAYNLVWHAGVPGLHAHLHLWAAVATWAGFEHGTGIPVVTVDPHDAAERLRGTLDAGPD